MEILNRVIWRHALPEWSCDGLLFAWIQFNNYVQAPIV